MSEQTQAPRLFRYGEDHAWEDPGAQFSNEDVRGHLTTFFPELAKATIDVADTPDEQGRIVVTFRKNAGTKAARELG
jgi:PRTRC genetic system protein C